MLSLQKKFSYQGDTNTSLVKEIYLRFNFSAKNPDNKYLSAIFDSHFQSPENKLLQDLQSDSYDISFPFSNYFKVKDIDAISRFYSFLDKLTINDFESLDNLAIQITVSYSTKNGIDIGNAKSEAILIAKHISNKSLLTGDESVLFKQLTYLLDNTVYFINKTSLEILFGELEKLKEFDPDQRKIVFRILFKILLRKDHQQQLTADEFQSFLKEEENLKINFETVFGIFQKHFDSLFDFPISIPEIKTITNNNTSNHKRIKNTNKKLRGQILELTKKCSLKDVSVIIQAKKEGDKIWRIVGSSKSDSAGNFSLSYPYGNYVSAQAIVSLTPDVPADIPINSVKENESIAGDFLYLLLNDAECAPTDKEDDCGCHSLKKAPRLPDHADLIGSDDYSQDIGGACVNLSTPNRTLSEFNYQAIVRTSDPDVSNYTLKKINVYTEVDSIDASLALNISSAISVLTDAIANGSSKIKHSSRNIEVVTNHLDALSELVLSGASSAVLDIGLTHINAIITLLNTDTSFVSPASRGSLVASLQAASALKKILNTALNGVEKSYELVGEKNIRERKPIDLSNPIAWQDAPDDKENLSIYQAVTIATGHILHYKSLFKADGYSLGDLIYSLPLAPGQKKEIVTFDATHTLQGAESQVLSQSEKLAADLASERGIASQLGGKIIENIRGSSSANTSGISAGFGTGGQGSGSTGAYGGSGSAVLGVAGGVANANSSASQNSSRDVSQFFGEKLRQSIMQNAESYRQLNASVVTTKQERQQYGVTSEVVANHNHCHSLTMMYFEVLRHYAIFQELSGVEECVFVPLLMTNFTTQNIYKWRDVLAQFLLPMPSETYLQPISPMGNPGLQHPLLKAFDANERIKTNYANVDFPQGSYDNEQIQFIKGEMFVRVELERPQTPYDRIKSLPIRLKNTPTKEIDTEAMANRALTSPNRVANAVKNEVVNSFISFFTGGLSRLVTGPPGQVVTEVVQSELGPQYKTVDHYSQVREAIFDAFMQLDANYETVPPAQCIRIKNFNPTNILGIEVSGLDFFHGNITDKRLWTAYANILGYENVLKMLDAFFSNNLIAEWDDIFYNQMAPKIFDKIVSSINISTIVNISGVSSGISTDFTSETRYKRGERLIRVNLNGTTTLKRNQLPTELKLSSASSNVKDLHDLVTLTVEDMTILYSTSHYNGVLFSGNVNNDLLDDILLFIPESSEEKRNPKKEDAYLVHKLIEHLNSNLEYYNRILWYNLDPDRRYMLLDGFNIQIFTDSGEPIGSDKGGMRSLASVVKNDLITITGNSLVFPVAAGYKVSDSTITEITEDGYTENVTLFDHYKPITPVEPYRISVPTRGVFAEAVQGACNACEKVQENTSQDWTKFTTDEPTPIAPVITPTPQITDWKAAFKEFASPIVNIQNAPVASTPGEGLANLSQLLGKSDIFKDITGLDGNQQNVLKTYLSNQDNAKAFASMAKEMAMQTHNTAHANSIMDSLNAAKDSGAINQDDYSKLVKEHLQQQIDGGQSQRAAIENAKKTEPSLSKAAIEAAAKNKDVKATKTDAEGNLETVEIKSNSAETILAEVNGTVPKLKQEDASSCWATVATMMMNWKRRQSLSVIAVLTPLGSKYVDMFKNAQGLTSEDKVELINLLGMAGEGPANYTIEKFVHWVNEYGPVWLTVDSAKTEGSMSPHAKLLTKIVRNSNSEIEFTSIDPSTGTEMTESFTDFIKTFEQMITDNSSGNPFIQVVHFKDKINPVEGGDPASVLTPEDKIAKLKTDQKLDFKGKKAYLDYLMAKPFADSLQSLYTLSKLKDGTDTVKILMERTSAAEKEAYKPYDDKGLLKYLKIIYDEDFPANLTDDEITIVAAFYTHQMEVNRFKIQDDYNSSGVNDTFTLKSFPKTNDTKDNVTAIIFCAIKYEIFNKKRISYILATANGESRFLPIMEKGWATDETHNFSYDQNRAVYYYSKDGGKQTYNYADTKNAQTQLSDYLISFFIASDYLVAANSVNRTFTTGSKIDGANLIKLNTLLATSMSNKTGGIWIDKALNLNDSKTLFMEMDDIVDKDNNKIITDDILMKADFYRYAGKGFVQVTWKNNYKNLMTIIKQDVPGFNVDLEKAPEELLDAQNAVYSLVLGLKHGAYKPNNEIAKNLKNNTTASWEKARAMVNGVDRKDEFGQCGKTYYEVLFLGRG